MTVAALELDDVTVRYARDRAPVLAGVSLSIAAGERVALLGLNGSGKTTLLSAAVGLVPHEGRICVGGVPVTGRTLPDVRRQVGFLFNVPEDQLFFPRAVDDAAFGWLRRGVTPEEARERAMTALARLGVAHLAEASLHELSHGQKQRVALAGALAGDPPLLLLDEPSAGLDPPGKRDLARLLRGLGAALLVATHDLAVAAEACTRLVVLDKGTIALDGADVTEVARRWGL